MIDANPAENKKQQTYGGRKNVMRDDTPYMARPNILVVDDSRDSLRFLSELFENEGYVSRTVSNARMAISSVAVAVPDLILLDIVMPGMSGYELCEYLKADEKTRDIPIIFISALDEVADKVRGFSLGGVDYITKPFQAEEVLARVGTHLALRNLQKRLETQNAKLQEALANVRTLKGLLPICSGCKKIRDDKGYWNHLEEYIERHSDALFSHSLCPSCEARFYGDQEWYQRKRCTASDLRDRNAAAS